MADAYIFEVHSDADVKEVDGRRVVKAKYVFDHQKLVAVPNTDPNRTIPVTSRHKDGRVFAHLLRMDRADFEKSSIPNDCYIESAFQCRLRPVAC
ncbi:hypothetical protein CJU35_05395 [Pseudomonas aeruginosa]|nr:hypothetical protein [Pseudomonas aeruginosa]PBV09289.1 hypothetical protein CJU35_05395 [Pseudomonas aeruginosa]